MQESNFSAEFGFTGGTVVNLVTRSGTNSFHGSAYEFLRHYKLDARDWFGGGQPVPPKRHNNFGATIGGPIRKNKTFFFLTMVSNPTLSARLSLGCPVCPIVLRPDAGDSI